MDNYHALENNLRFIKGFVVTCLRAMSFFWAFNYENLAIRDSEVVGLRREEARALIFLKLPR